jgi:nucleoside-diphosphate-sugar epimerase
MTNYWKGRKILITGAGGFIGSNAVEYFAKKGAKVTANYHKKISSATKHKPNINFVYANLLNPEKASKICKDQDIVFNFAAVDGSTDFKEKNSQKILSNNLTINLNMFKAASGAKVKKFIFVSSSEISTSKTPSAYVLSKSISEAIGLAFSRQFHFDLMLARPSNIYGPHDHFDNNNNMRFVPLCIKKIMNGETIFLRGDGMQKVNFLYVIDYLDMLSKLIEKEAYGFPINIASNNYVALKDIIVNIGKIMNIKPNIKIDKTISYRNSKHIDLTTLNKYLDGRKETNIHNALVCIIRDYKSKLSNEKR